MVKFSFLFVILVNFRVPVLGIDMNDLEKDAEGSLEALDNILSSFQGDEACEFKCPNEGEVKKPRPGHKPTSNGCGSFGIKLETSSLPEMTRCCDVHDFCYDTCGKVRADCDDQFQLCLYEMCEAKKTTFTTDQYEGCKMAAELMHGGTSSLGCHSYLESQKKACQCTGGQRDPLKYLDEEVKKKKRDVLDVLSDLDGLLDLDTKDEL
ncbi:group XIIA secretory phospholipase A2-like [Lineus longissimus]|uniref:group XIIA secretory phospholipase A2-like n=1 Tax=Lineus longissimus TaxID=88925 RepID=UPI00315DBD46